MKEYFSSNGSKWWIFTKPWIMYLITLICVFLSLPSFPQQSIGWWLKKWTKLVSLKQSNDACDDNTTNAGNVQRFISIFSKLIYRSNLADGIISWTTFQSSSRRHFFIRNLTCRSVFAVQPPSYTFDFRIPLKFSTGWNCGALAGLSPFDCVSLDRLPTTLKVSVQTSSRNIWCLEAFSPYF